MERITSHQVVDLMEAYNAVYAPQINEEQIQEDFEIWVNSLVEEGYDLSEYTWDDMYEEYITELIGQKGSAGMVDFKDRNSGQVRSAYKSSSDGKLYKNYNDALAAKNSRMQGLAVQQGLNRTYRAGGGNAAVAQGKNPLAVMAQGSTNLQRQQRPSTPSPGGVSRPAAPAGAKPATSAPAGAQRPIPSGTTVPVRPATPAPAGAKPATPPARNGFGAPTAPMAAQGSVSSATAPAPSARPSIASDIESIRQMRKASQQRIMSQGGTPATSLVQSFDPFDVVLGHLIDEGYADTEQAALQIMANMSEEWRENILIDEGLMDAVSKVGKVVGKVAGDVQDRLTGKKELVSGPRGYIKVGGPSKAGDVRVSGLGPIGTYGRPSADSGGSRGQTSTRTISMTSNGKPPLFGK